MAAVQNYMKNLDQEKKQKIEINGSGGRLSVIIEVVMLLVGRIPILEKSWGRIRPSLPDKSSD